ARARADGGRPRRLDDPGLEAAARGPDLSRRGLLLAVLTACGVVVCTLITIAGIARLYREVETSPDWILPGVMLGLLVITLTTQVRLLILLGMGVVRLWVLSGIR